MRLRVKPIGRKMMMAVFLLLSGVSCINEDLSDCGKEYSVHYDVRLVTNLDTELETELETIEEKQLREKLRKALSNIFTDQARDLDLRFYGNDSVLSYAEQHVINSNNASYTIYLPVQDYQHMALANDDQEKNVILQSSGYAQHLAWKQVAGDTLNSYENGLFSARLLMEVKEDEEQEFHVRLYMQNSAAALVLNPNGVKVKSIRGALDHLADGFTVRDSIYHYHDAAVIRTKEIEDTGSALRCLYGVGFPSRDVPMVAGKLSKDAEAADMIWEFQVFVTLENGSVTKTVLHVKQPLKAGYLKIIKANLQPDGSVTTDSPEVGASVELDWEPGGEYNPEI